MPRQGQLRAGLTTKQQLFDVPVPQATRTYGPIANRELYDFVRNTVSSHNLNITNEDFMADAGGKVMLCRMHIQSNDLEMDQMIAFWNSYNKTKAVSFATGSIVRVCANGMMWSDGPMGRYRHHRDRWQYIQTQLEEAIGGCQEKFEQCKKLRKAWKSMPIDYNNTAKLAGQLYFDDIISPRMLSDVKRETTESNNFSYVDADGVLRGNVWKFYNNCTEALKRSSASTYAETHDRLTKRLIRVTGVEL